MLLIHCPHCQHLIEIVELNCRIFRCGVYKNNGQPIPPHASRQECDNFIARDEIFGCGKPFRIDESNIAVICDYI